MTIGVWVALCVVMAAGMTVYRYSGNGPAAPFLRGFGLTWFGIGLVALFLTIAVDTAR